MKMRPDESPALIGRSSELAALQMRVDALSGGTGALAVVSGEAGSGKTRLVEELLAGLKAPVVAASASVYDYAQAPYAPIRDVLAALDARMPKVLAKDETLRAALQPIRALGDAVDGGDPQAARRRALDAAVEAFGKYAAAAPLVVTVEDVQWIDQASADVLMHLCAQVERSRLALVLTYRTNDEAESAAGRELVARLVRRARGGSIALRALSDLDARALVDAVASADVDPATRRSICELGDGNPLLLLELTEHAATAPRGSGDALPLSLRAIVDERIAAFGRDERYALQVAALLGEFEVDTLMEVAGADRDTVLGLLRRALAKRVLVEAPVPRATYSFRHALIRRAVSDQMLAAERTQLHGHIARLLETRGAAPATVAQHYELAGDGRLARSTFVLAGDQAIAALAFSDAADAYRRAIEACTVDDEAIEIGWKLIAAAELAVLRLEQLRTIETLCAHALESGARADASRLQIEVSRWCFTSGDDERAAIAAVRAYEIGASLDHTTAMFEGAALASWYLAHLRRLDDANAWLDRAIAHIADGTPRSLTWYHEARAVVDVHSGACVTWRDDLERVFEIAQSQHSNLAMRRFDSAAALALASNLDDFEFALSCLHRSERRAAESGASPMSLTFTMAAYVQYMLGDLAASRRSLVAGFSAAGDDLSVTTMLARTGIPVALRLGDVDLLRRCTGENILDFAYQSTSPQVFGPVAASFAEKLVADGRRAEAATLLARTVARLESAGNNLAILVDVARFRVTDAKPAARDLLRGLAPTSRSGAAALALFDAYFSAGDERRRRASVAAAGFEALKWPLWQAEALELAGDAAAARAIYARCGAVVDKQRLDGERGAGEVPGGLSRREWDVALLVAQGKSNRAIAEALVLSERTVENHIASIFNKRSLRSRAEIASFVAREERLPLAK
jgi:DNA-binding CsgD family transcriptional regulator